MQILKKIASFLTKILLRKLEAVKQRYFHLMFSRPPRVGDVVVFSLPEMFLSWPYWAIPIFFKYFDAYKNIYTAAGFQNLTVMSLGFPGGSSIFSGVPLLVLDVSPSMDIRLAIDPDIPPPRKEEEIQLLPVGSYARLFLKNIDFQNKKALGFESFYKCRRIQVYDHRTGLTLTLCVQASHISLLS